MESKNTCRCASLVATLLLVAQYTTIQGPAQAQGQLSPRARKTAEAWRALDKNPPQPTQALKLADEVIREFRAQARGDQKRIANEVKNGAPAPLEGRPPSKAAADRVHRNGVLNDVSVC
jgi:hypothetical protein